MVKLAAVDAGLFVGETARVSGWGRAYDSSTTISPVLRVVESNILTNEDCRKRFGFAVFKSVICLDGSQKKSSCNVSAENPS